MAIEEEKKLQKKGRTGIKYFNLKKKRDANDA